MRGAIDISRRRLAGAEEVAPRRWRNARLAFLVPLVLIVARATFAQPYSTHRAGDVVQLQDARTQTIVSILPSVGNIAFEMKVKGENILYWPYGSIEEFKARPGMSGIPFLGPWADRLDEQAFFANGRRFAFDMQLGKMAADIADDPHEARDESRRFDSPDRVDGAMGIGSYHCYR